MNYRCLHAILLFLGMAGLMESGATLAQDELFVANRGNNSITVYSRTAGIDDPPLRIISGAATKLFHPIAVAVDNVHNEIMVANIGDFTIPGSASITVYGWNANGDVGPLRMIAGDASGLHSFRFLTGGLVVDTLHDEIFATTTDDVVNVWSRTANGNSAPLRTLGGYPAMAYLGGLALDTINDELLVTTRHAVFFYPRSASGSLPPQRLIGGDLSDILPAGIALDSANNEIAVTSLEDDTVKIFARNASGNVAPLRTIFGDSAGIRWPVGIAIDPVHNELVVSSAGNVWIAVHARTTNGDVEPLRIIGEQQGYLDGNLHIALGTPALPLNSHDYVQRVYVAYYGRPADPAGQDYWAARMDIAGHSLDAIVSEFGNSDEFNRRYGGLGYPALVTKIYQQALARDPDVGGLNFYVTELQAGRRTLQSITLDVLNGAATAPDATVVANKLDVAANYTAKIAQGCPYGTELDGVNVLAGVTADVATVVAAKAAINSRCGF